MTDLDYLLHRQILHSTQETCVTTLIGNPGQALGWIYDAGTWYKFGLSDTSPITSNRYSGVTHYGVGIAPDATNRMKIGGNFYIDGNLDVSGNYGSADKYTLATGLANSNNGTTYGGDGATATFAISAGHTSYSLLVFLNGVCQVPGVDYQVVETQLTSL